MLRRRSSPTRSTPWPWLLGVGLAGCMQSAPGPQPRARDREDGADSAATATPAATAPSHGFNDAIAWQPLADGLAHAKATARPLMLVVHASWCSQCSKLKPAFSDRELAELSEHFVMVNADQDEDPDVLAYAPDGTYIPRVLFFDGRGDLDATLANARRSRQRYYYGPSDDLVGTMREALQRHGRS